MVKPMTSLSPSSLHRLEYEETRAYVQRKTQLGRRGSPLIGERTRVLETLTRAVLQRLRVRGLRVVREGFESEEVENLFSQVMCEQFERDEQVRWLVTEALIHHRLNRSTPDPTRQKSESAYEDAQRSAGANALLMLEGGRSLTHDYHQRASSGGTHPGLTFWKHCQVTIHNRTIDALRKNRTWWKFWKKEVSIDISDDEEAYRVPVPRDPHRVGEAALAQAQRHQARLEALAALRHLAEQDVSPTSGKGVPQKPDPNSARVLKYLDWLLEQLEDETSNKSQAEFARVAGLAPGTLNSALLRFREKHKLDASALKAMRKSDLYTTVGGSQS